MMKFAQFISVMAHPLFMPSYAFSLLMYTNPYVNMMISDSTKNVVIIILSLFTIVLPIVTAILLKQLRVIDSIYMKSSEERKWPFVFTLVWYYLAFQLLAKLYIPQSFLLLMLGAIIAIGLSLIITLRWKVSIHMLGFGGLIGAIIGISQRFQFDHSNLIMVLVIFAGLIGYARLKTHSHNYRQVYVGFLLGVFVEWVSVLYL
ncbi:MAG: hypothetical protein ISR00_00400 [Flavobacteriales bacterium]|nr:hypothetical protein [Flavobacteriales bacterium]MBL6872393.1 hypothetical protein [Flavobacteriales bacterium]